jgi:hypothetical protein
MSLLAQVVTNLDAAGIRAALIGAEALALRGASRSTIPIVRTAAREGGRRQLCILSELKHPARWPLQAPRQSGRSTLDRAHPGLPRPRHHRLKAKGEL